METKNVTMSTNDDTSDPLVTPDMLKLFTLVSYVILTGPISLFGIIFNIINIIVFMKMGYKDPVNITLTALAIADGCCLFPLLWISICYNPYIIRKFPNIDFMGVQHITAGWPHVFLTRISSWMTAFITFERYLCVAFPLKIKNIVTPLGTFIAVICVYVIIISSIVPVFVGVGLGSYVISGTNQTIVSLAYTANGYIYENGSVSFLTFSQLTSFALVVVCTAGLVQKIQSKAKWRNETSSASKNSTASSRDRTLVKMIICISSIFISMYTPVIIASITMLVYEDYGITGKYSNFFQSTGTIFYLLESINATINIFVYLKMSSKYKEVFMSLFRLNQNKAK